MGLINPPRMRFLDKRVNLNKGAQEEDKKSGQTLGQNLGQNSDSEDEEEDDILTLKRTNHDLEDLDLDPELDTLIRFILQYPDLTTTR